MRSYSKTRRSGKPWSSLIPSPTTTKWGTLLSTRLLLVVVLIVVVVVVVVLLLIVAVLLLLLVVFIIVVVVVLIVVAKAGAFAAVAKGRPEAAVVAKARALAAEDALNADETAQRWVALERASKLDERLSGGDRVSPHFEYSIKAIFSNILITIIIILIKTCGQQTCGQQCCN